MKILQINKFFYQRGGADRHFFELMRLLTDRGHEVVPFSMIDKRNEPSPYSKYFVSHLELADLRFDLIKHIPRVFYSTEAARKLEALIDETQPDIAHAHLLYYHLSPSVLDVLKRKKIPVVYTIHDWKLVCPNSVMYGNGGVCDHCLRGRGPFGALTHRCVKNSYGASMLAMLEFLFNAKKYRRDIDMLIAPTDFVKHIFVERGWSADKIKVINHFVPTVSDMPSHDGGETYALYAGRLSEEKGVLFLVRTWINERIPYNLVIAGTGPLENEIKKIIREAHAEKIIQLKGFVASQDLAPLMRRATVLVAPSLTYETFGLGIAEAMGQGIPVVTTDMGGQAELMRLSEGGVAVPPDARAFSGAVDMLMKDAKKRLILAKNGFTFVHTKLTEDTFYDKLMQVYYKVTH